MAERQQTVAIVGGGLAVSYSFRNAVALLYISD